MRYLSVFFLICVLYLREAASYNFPYESVQLTGADIGTNKDLTFGDPESITTSKASGVCKTYPEDASWPSDSRWVSFNESLGGALIQGVPTAAVCYQGWPGFDATRCATARTNWLNSAFFMEDPASIMEPWLQGDRCPLPSANSSLNVMSCSSAGVPAFVVNATTVKHVQLAVNFARNNNLRLTIKNSGHDFSGRSAGGGALSIWTHYLKAFEYLPSFSIGEYHGQAARVGAGLQTYDLSSYMRQYNITLITPGGNTVGAIGGYLQGGGHSGLTSYYGMMSDQVLSLEVVTADGKFLHVDMNENEDLWYAMRGGGGSTYGVLISAIIKAHSPISSASASINFSMPKLSENAFWEGIRVYHAHIVRLCDAKGFGFNYIRTAVGTGNSSRTYSFTTSISLPGMSRQEGTAFMAPLLSDLKLVGIASAASSVTTSSFATISPAAVMGDTIQTRHLSSRLFPRENFEDPTSDIFNRSVQAIKDSVVQGGYLFHSINHCPTLEAAGYPGTNSALVPAYRKAVMHASAYDEQPYDNVPPAQQVAYHSRLNEYMQKWRDVTPGSGSYMNEADVDEPDFQTSFYGSNYPKLLQIKKKRDPWRLFYATTGVGSEDWKLQGTDGLSTQDGKLCRV
ncbi:FAD/FMN-containing isoamyl alcohol oxidase-like protein MreA [Crepidotus variabilis]|uniref:FAD/FMN-containing isoamyl alcohol oxidase-like protein MreA n=1 Tax=Crepidotus variabilis TaxID=179855 RepID=A0A9P6EA71_9AGAR|nr:FAD/FMN-containing isoamyl alcohol oxidase-like protein MreA [Crepidotus variabilis]